MSEFKNLEQSKSESSVPETIFELAKSPEGREIKKRLEKEYYRRIVILKDILAVLEIPEDSVVLAPPVFDRTDFGYTSDIDLVFLGTDEQGEKLYRRLYTSFEILPFIIQIDPERLAEIKDDLPEFYQFLTHRRGNIPTKQGKTEISSGDFWEKANELEAKTRVVLSSDDKLVLKEQRLKIGHSFVSEIQQKVPVLGSAFSGSMMTDMQRFGINSDLDIELLTNPPDNEKAERNVFDWIHVYLKWKYAEEFGIRIDIGDTNLKFARMMASHDPKFVDYYKREFDIDITEEFQGQ